MDSCSHRDAHASLGQNYSSGTLAKDRHALDFEWWAKHRPGRRGVV